MKHVAKFYLSFILTPLCEYCHEISLPLPERVFYFISYQGYHALLVLGKDIPLKYVFKHIFLFIVLFTLIILFSFPLVGLTFLEVYII